MSTPIDSDAAIASGADSAPEVPDLSNDRVERECALVLGGVDWARRRGTTRLLLEVHHGNAPAIALYRSHGFQPVARRDNYYGAGEHADVMQLALDSDDHLVGEEGEQR